MPSLPDMDSPSEYKKVAGKISSGVKALTGGGGNSGGGGGAGGDVPQPSGATTSWSPTAISVPSYKKGGRVRKTGLAKLHRGERVLNKRQEKRYEKSAGGKR